MKLRSLGLRSDLFFLRRQAQVEDRGDYLICRSPDEPGYHWGNLLVFPGPPKTGDLARWMGFWGTEFGADARVRHVTFAWDGTDGDRGASEEFEPAGFEYEEDEVLVAEEVTAPPHPTPNAVVRPLEGDAEWAAAVECALHCRDLRFEAAPYEGFATRRMAAQRRLVETGAGVWLGAFLGSDLVADLGLFIGDGIARYQSVQTHPDHRRKGLCGTLVSAAATYGRENMGAGTFVMLADPGDHAGRVYQAVGFEFRERVGGLARAP